MLWIHVTQILLKRIVAFGAPFGAILENELNQLEEMLLNHKNVLLYTF